MIIDLQIQRDDGKIVNVSCQDEGEIKPGVFRTHFIVEGVSHYSEFVSSEIKGDGYQRARAREQGDLKILASLGFSEYEFVHALDRFWETARLVAA